jgi:nitric oxide reductase activation protein
MAMVVMSDQPKEPAMQDGEFDQKMTQIMTDIAHLPAEERVRLEALASETRTRHEKLRKTVNSLQESLDHLRLSIKYLVFDLEATRRENQYLRKLLEETGKDDEQH